MASAIAVAFAVVVVLLGMLVVGLLRSHAEILRALHDLGVNLEDGPTSAATARPRSAARRSDVAPEFASPRPGPLGAAHDITGVLPGGGAASIAVAGVEHRTLLAFLSTGCGTCGTFWEALDAPDRQLPGGSTRLAIVTNGPDAELPAAVQDLAPTDVLTVMSSQAWDDYRVPVSPYFVLVDGPSAQVVGEGAGVSWEQVVDLLQKAAADLDAASATSRARITRMSGQDRADRVDRELLAAGIEPGDPSLYPTVHPSHEAEAT